MSRKEVKQPAILEKLKRKEITQKEAAKALGMSDRTVRRRMKRFLSDGIEGLSHKNRGRQGKKWVPVKKEFMLELVKSEWSGFGPTFVAEKLHELHGIIVSKETVRKAMIEAQVWNNKPRKTKYRHWRERKACFGMMIQLDGSPHDWFEGRAPRCTLLVFIDDATGRVYMEFAPSESLESIMKATRNYVMTHGCPVSLYVDYGSVFSVNTNNAEREKKTQFERAMKELGIQIIHAGSPQAKGRVERSHQTHQDRLVKELRLRNISTIEEANVFLKHHYIPAHNAKFSVAAADITDMHTPIAGRDLHSIMCIKESRIIQNNHVISYKNQLFQLHKQQKTIVLPKEKVTVHETLEGAISLFIRKTELYFSKIDQRPVVQTSEKIRQLVYRKPHPNSQLWNQGKIISRRVG